MLVALGLGGERSDAADRDRMFRVLRLQDGDKHFAYLVAGFDDKHPARPLPGLKEALKPWAEADPRG